MPLTEISYLPSSRRTLAYALLDQSTGGCVRLIRRDKGPRLSQRDVRLDGAGPVGWVRKIKPVPHQKERKGTHSS